MRIDDVVTWYRNWDLVNWYKDRKRVSRDLRFVGGFITGIALGFGIGYNLGWDQTFGLKPGLLTLPVLLLIVVGQDLAVALFAGAGTWASTNHGCIDRAEHTSPLHNLLAVAGRYCLGGSETGTQLGE